MTTFASGHHVAKSKARSVDVIAIVVCWAVARTSRGGAAVLSVSIDDGRAVAVLREEDGSETAVGEGGPVRVERVGEIEHVDVPGVVSLSVRRGAGGRVELLYARTPLLDVLGVPGGCAERPEMVAPVS